MATKKQKHARAMAKREAFMDQVEADGLAALKADKERQAKKEAEMITRVQEVDKRHRNILAQRLVAEVKKDHPDITVGEFLEASNRLFPTFSG